MEGLITIFAGFIFTLFIPPKAGDGRPLISGGRWSYFTERESQIIRDRVVLDDPLKAQGHIKITGRDIWDTVRQANVLQHFFISLISMSAYQGLNHYTPSMIKSFGFGNVNANALASVPVYCSMVWTLALSYIAYVRPTSYECPTSAKLSGIDWVIVVHSCCYALPGMSFRTRVYGQIHGILLAGINTGSSRWPT